MLGIFQTRQWKGRFLFIPLFACFPYSTTALIIPYSDSCHCFAIYLTMVPALFYIQTLCMMVNIHNDDILSIKKRLADITSSGGEEPSFVMATKDMFLLWNGRPLDDDCVLADYHMTTKSMATVFCHQRKRGGCFAVSASVLVVIFASILGSTVTCGASLIMVPLLLPLLLVLPLCCL